MSIVDYSAPIQSVYQACVDRFLINIASHFNVKATGNTGTFDWQVLKLSEMGQLKRENTKIIADMVSQNEPMIELALQQSMLTTLSRTDKTLAAAARRALMGGNATNELSEFMKQILRLYSQQAVAQANLVNTVMLTDSLNRARRVIASVTAAQSYLRDITQGVLNTQTGEVITGITSHQLAVRQAVQQLAKDGITGFVDKAGRRWEPDAYMAMDIRTTAGNVANEAAFQQAREAGHGLVIWPVNATARPGCAPWQGKICSINNVSGYTTDLDGNRHPVYALRETTYGQRTGLVVSTAITLPRIHLTPD